MDGENALCRSGSEGADAGGEAEGGCVDRFCETAVPMHRGIYGRHGGGELVAALLP